MTEYSVLVKEACVARELLWLLAEELAILVHSEDVHVIELFSEASSSDWGVFRLLPVDDEALDLTAGESWTGGTELLRIPCASKTVVIWVLVHDHGLSIDAWVPWGAPERRSLSILELPCIARGVAHQRPEVAVVVVHPSWAVVPAVSLTYRLQVFAGAAAVALVPAPLIDGIAKALIREVGKLGHVGPEEERWRRAPGCAKLDEADIAIWIGGRVGWVSLHLAVAASDFATLRVKHAPRPPFEESMVVLWNLLPSRLDNWGPALRVSSTWVSPLVGELGHVRLHRL